MTSSDTGFDDVFEENDFENSTEKNEVPKLEPNRNSDKVVEIYSNTENENTETSNNYETFQTPNDRENIIQNQAEKNLLSEKYCLFFKTKKNMLIILLLSTFVVIAIFGGIISTRSPKCGKVSIHHCITRPS